MMRDRLARPLPIASQTWPNGTQPLVSILCPTYNQERYIDTCLRGFLLQETTFPVEIVVQDDASTDATAKIIRDYAERHPRLFRPIFQETNQYSQGRKPLLLAFPHSRGSYIATCDGDDYWTFPAKLQKQIELLERFPECILCGGRIATVRDGASTPYRIEPSQDPETLDRLGAAELLKGIWSIRTASRVARRSVWSGYAAAVGDSPQTSDYLFMLYCISLARSVPGKLRCIDEVVGVYRENTSSIWFPLPVDEKVSASIAILEFALENFDFGELTNIVEWTLLGFYRSQANNWRDDIAYWKKHIELSARRNMRRLLRLVSDS